VRPYNWETSVSVQHEVMRGVSVNLAYYRRTYGNFQVNDNLLVEPSDYSPYSVTAPADPRLPNGGSYPITDLWDLNQNRVGQNQTITTSSSDYGDQYENWNGADLSAQARLAGGVILQGGLSTGKTTTDNCDVAPKIDNPSQRYCHNETPYLTQYKFGGSYTLPYDIQASATIQSFIGAPIQANATFTNGQIAPSLGRSLSQGTTATVTLLEPNTLYNERVTQLDLRFAKNFRIGQSRIKGMLDIFNATNNNTITGVNNSYGTTGAAWRVPTAISLARLLKVGVQVDF
jgi:hypothetical protein